MRRISLLMLLLIFPILKAYSSVEIDGIYYDLDNIGKTAQVISGSEKYTDSITIPSQITYNDVIYSVTSIGGRAFFGCSGLTSITIGNCVTSIGDYAFYNCSSLTSITIPYSITSIGFMVFDSCPIKNVKILVTDFTICNNNRILPYFYHTPFFQLIDSEGKEIKEIVIPEGVTAIGNNAFYGCSSLTSITIPEGVTNIGDNAFQDCFRLTSITIPESVTSIGDYAFYNCSSLTSIIIPNKVTSIGTCAFSGCDLTSITIPEGVTSIGEGAFRDTPWINNQPDGLVYAGFVAYQYKGVMPDGTEVVLKEGTKCIADGAFSGYTSLTSITIPNSVTSIGHYAFGGCRSLTSITIPYGVSAIEAATFFGCSSLTSVTIPNSVTSIGAIAFDGCRGLTSISIPNSVSFISFDVFANCPNMTTVYINSDSIMSRNYESYYLVVDEYKSKKENIGSLFGAQVKEYVLGDSVKGIGEFAFYNCVNLASISIPQSVTRIGEYAFYGCDSAVFKIIVSDYSAFCNNKVLGNLEYELSKDQHIKLVDASGEEIKDFVVPDDVLSIGEYAFCDCSGLTSISIPNSVTSIGRCAFGGCRGLTSITIPNNVTSIEKYAFFDCDGLSTIVVKEGNVAYDSPNNCNAIIDKRTHTLIQGCKNTVIPNDVTIIGEGAFSRHSGLSSIAIPEGVTSIERNAFYGCSNLTSIILPKKLTSIGDVVFYGCSGLSSIVIPEGVTSIGEVVFYGCSNLTSITIPERVTSIGWGAFNYCQNLSDIYCSADPSKLTWETPSDGFKENKATIFHVAASDLEAYQTIFGNANVTFVGDLPTRVENTLMEVQKNDLIFDLNGRRVEGQLSKGIYIKNGKKFIVK